MKNAYLIIPDLHYAVKKEHRRNYLGEVMSVLMQIMDVRKSYEDRGYSVSAIFLGDVIDGPITQAEDAMRCQNLFRYYCSLFEHAYCVMGNHEANNVVSNPFWFLVSELADPALSGIMKALQPQGVEPVFLLPATVTDGEVTFYFNHYGLNPKIPADSGVAVGLFHQNVGSNDICKMWGTFTDVEEAAFMQAYNWSFFGHMHLAVGRFYLNKQHTCVGDWLGTCVGTNVTEVEQLPRECKIPAVLVDSGKFAGVEDNTIQRSDPSVAIDYQKLSATQATKELVNSAREVTVQNLASGTLFQRIKQSADEAYLGELLELLCGSEPTVRFEYKQGMEQFVSGRDSSGE